MGRVMRAHEGKEYALWLDHSGNYLRFRDDWDELYTIGVEELDNQQEKAKKEPTDQEKTESKCPSCGHLWPKGSDSCPSCGYVRQKRNAVEAVAGELHELTSGSNAVQGDRQHFYSELLFWATSRNYNPKWAAHKYREKFGMWPRGLVEQPIPTTTKTASWIKSRNIAWAKANAKNYKLAGGR